MGRLLKFGLELWDNKMSILDILTITIVVSFTLASAAWGFVRQVIAVGGLLVGLWLASAFNTTVAGWLGFIDDPAVAKGLAFVLVVFVVSTIASLVASVLYFMVGLLFLGWLDHLLGAFLGFVQGVLMLGVFMIAALTMFPDWTQQQLPQSFIANQLVGGLTNIALVVAPQDLKHIVQQAIARL
jgi:membrane protein required for colicin V production